MDFSKPNGESKPKSKVGKMNLISLLSDLKILAGSAILFLWIVWRSDASSDSRTRVGFNLLVSSILLLPIIAGISFLSGTTPFGKSEALLQGLIFFLVVFEILLRQSRDKIIIRPYQSVVAAIIFFFLGFVNGIYNQVSFNPSIFFAPIAFVLFLILAPSRESMRDIYKLSCLAILINFSLQILKFDFQPDQNTAITVVELSSETQIYANSLWGFTGIFERYQGPFTHPNGLGTYIGLMVVLLTASQEKFTRSFVLLGWYLLLLSSSRGAILSTMMASLIIVTVRLIYKYGKRKVVSSKLVIVLVSLLGIVISQLLRTRNPTLTGRTVVWERYLELWRSSPIFGVGIQLRSVESSYVWTLAAMGIVGFIGLISVFYIVFRSIPKDLTSDGVLPFAVFIWLIVRCFTEATYVFYSWDSATLALLCISVFLRSKAGPSQNSFELKRDHLNG